MNVPAEVIAEVEASLNDEASAWLLALMEAMQ